ncbi:MAG: HU family DNA-binding protein [Prevotella sp.]|nr:HU family DNA-binding protein [Prevotella sp.]
MDRISIQEIAAILTVKSGLKKKDAERFATTLFEVVKDGLESERLVKVKGLGTFKVIDIEARESVNVNTGERVLIEGHEKISFTPDATMKELVNKPFSQFETVVLNEGVEFDDAATVAEPAEEELAVEAPTVEAPTVEEPPVEEPPVEEPPVEEPPVEEPPVEEPPVEEPSVEEPSVEEPSVEEPKVEDLPVEEPPVEEPKVEEQTAEEQSVEESHDDEPPAEEPPVEEPPVEEASVAESPVDEPPVEEPLAMMQQQEPAEEIEKETVEIEEEQEMNTKTDNTRLKTIAWLAIAIAACLASFVGGYFLGLNKGLSMTGNVFTSIEEVADSTEQIPVKDTAKVEAKAKVQDVDAPAFKAEPSKPVEVVESPVDRATPPTTPPAAPAASPAAGTDKYAEMDNRVRYGAYRIVGPDYEVTAKAGESTARVSKRTLGPDMECYIEVYNGLKPGAVLEAGKTVKIPKLELKKKLKKK